MKKAISVLLVLSMLLCFNCTVFASETSDFEETSISLVSSKSISGYGNRVTGSSESYYEVYASGSSGGGAGITLKNECGSNGAFVYVSIQKPDGSYFNNNVYMDGNSEKQFQIWFTQTGKYKIHYVAYTPGSTIYMQCWIYG